MSGNDGFDGSLKLIVNGKSKLAHGKEIADAKAEGHAGSCNYEGSYSDEGPQRQLED